MPEANSAPTMISLAGSLAAREVLVQDLVNGSGWCQYYSLRRPPIIVRLPLADGLSARVLDVRLQLAPREHEVRLVVDSLFFIHGIGRGGFGRLVLSNAQVSEMEIHLLVHGRDGLKVAH